LRLKIDYISLNLPIKTHILQIKKALSIAGVVSYTSGWRSRDAACHVSTETGAQIDLLIDRNDNIINLCEMKYSNKQFVITKSQDENLRNKLGAFVEETHTRKTVHITMITIYGVKRNEYRNNIQSEVTMENLFD
jgi:hypothetical protein